MNQVLRSAAEPAAAPADLYAPIAGDLEEVERILEQTLLHPCSAIADVVGHVRHYRGKRLRPALPAPEPEHPEEHHSNGNGRRRKIEA